MKKLLLVLVLLGMSFNVISQEKLNEGIIISKQTMSSDDEQMQAQFAMIGDMVTTTYFKDDKTRGEASNPMTGNIITITDASNKKMLMMMDSPMVGKKYQINEMNISDEQMEAIKIEKGTETKTILGYKCNQYIIDMGEGEMIGKMEIFSTEDISAFSQQTAMLGDKLKGFPLYFKMTMNQMGAVMTITNEVTEIKKESVSSDKFSLTPPEGYEEM